MPSSLVLQPIAFSEACQFIREYHRHHIPPVGWKWGVACNNGTDVVGVITVGRPVSRHLDNGWTLEVTRCCTDGTKNAASMLYGAAWRAAKALGYKRLITYVLASEPGTTLVAAGWTMLYESKGGEWSCASRPRVNKHPTEPKRLWEQRTTEEKIVSMPLLTEVLPSTPSLLEASHG